MSDNLAPIVLFIYNRPDHTRKTLEALSKNILAEQSELFIFADGPKETVTEEQLEKIHQTRAIAHEKKWCKTVTVIEADKNKGLAASIIFGVTDIVNKYGKIIVLEDDLITSPYFLKYMNDSLLVYENTENVACIHGFMYQHKTKLPETFFIKGADCWGWATWKRAWSHFNSDSQYLLDEIKRRHLEKHFNFNNTYDYTGMLQMQIDGKISSWAIRWLTSAYLDDMYCLYPAKSLVINDGFDGSGTHCGEGDGINHTLLTDKPVNIEWQEPKECKKAWSVFCKTFKIKRNFSIRALISKLLPTRIKKIIKSIIRK